MGGWTTFDTMLVLIVNVTIVAAVVIAVVVGYGRRLGRGLRVLDAKLVALDEVLTRVQDEWRYQHEQASYVGTVEGLWHTLEEGAKHGGLPLDFRQTIYRAGNEAFQAYHDAARSHDDAGGGHAELFAAEPRTRSAAAS